MQTIKIGMIGTGYIGKAHAVAYAQAPVVFPLKAKLVREMIAEMTLELAQRRAAEFGFNRSTMNWHELVADPTIDVVDICTPNFLHKEMALAAIQQGKHVYCEKPLALSALDAKEMVVAAQHYKVHTLVGFNYLKNPTTQLAKEIISGGEIGEVIHFYGTHNEDYMMDPLEPIHWHCYKKMAGLGALGDLGAHIVSIARYLVGDIAQVCGDLTTVIKQRPISHGASEQVIVENEDQAHGMIRFCNGAIGVLETSRIAAGKKMGLTYMVTGTKGSLYFTQERMAELKLYQQETSKDRQGFKTILTGPYHPDYAAFCQAAGHGIGFNDQKTVEIRDLINAIAEDRPAWPDFYEGYKVSQVLDALSDSYEQGGWISIQKD